MGSVRKKCLEKFLLGGTEIRAYFKPRFSHILSSSNMLIKSHQIQPISFFFHHVFFFAVGQLERFKDNYNFLSCE